MVGACVQIERHHRRGGLGNTVPLQVMTMNTCCFLGIFVNFRVLNNIHALVAMHLSIFNAAVTTLLLRKLIHSN